ncbi:MAG TPA: N-acetyltransferase [Devosia sp.]|nr:N-acetyltransferase [Devosia sp.]
MTIARLIKMLPDPITTERLVLRQPNMADAPALHRLANNRNIFEMLARLPHPYTRAHAVDFITSVARSASEHAYAITSRDDDFLGVIGLHLPERKTDGQGGREYEQKAGGKASQKTGPELGYWLGQPHWGKGYATEAVKGLLAAAHKVGITTISAHAITRNTGSINVLLKAGFIISGQTTADCGQHQKQDQTILKWEAGT